MITNRSEKHEIRDLQRMLIDLGLLEWCEDSESGWWGSETQEAVRRGYASLGWEHPREGLWVTSAALASLAAAAHHHHVADGAATGAGATHGYDARAAVTRPAGPARAFGGTGRLRTRRRRRHGAPPAAR